jgi:predicted permease
VTGLRVLASRVRGLFRRRRLDAELDEEIRLHLELLTEEHQRRGMSPREARAAARRDFGGVEPMKEAHRDQRGSRWIDAFRQDVRFAARLLRKDRWFAFVAVIALALGIGGNNTVFTFAVATRLRGLPVEEPDRILSIRTRDGGGRDQGLSYREFHELRNASSFDGIAAFSRMTATVTDEGLAPEQFQGLYVSFDAFRLLGIPPALGRDFLSEDDRVGAPATVMLGDEIWKARYGGDPGIVGRIIGINGVPTTVLGVMPAGFEFDYFAELWLPLAQSPALSERSRDARILQAFGRLAESTSRAQAQVELDTLADGLAREHPDTNADVRATAAPFTGTIGQDPLLLALMGAVGFVLLIACANVANLLLARSAHRGREIAVRQSLGATRWRIVRQLLVESSLLTLVAGVVGFGISIAGVRLLSGALDDIAKPYWIRWTMDGRVFAFFALVCLATGVLFSLAPALHLSRTQAIALKEGGRAGGGARARRWSAGLMTLELASTMALLAGAALLARSFLTLYRIDLAVDTTHLTTMALRLPEAKYPRPEQWSLFARGLEERLGAIGGISSATIASAFPFAGADSRQLQIEGFAPPSGKPPAVSRVVIGARYFETLGLSLLRGRAFTARDGTSGHESAIVNQLFASAFFPGQDPIGRRIRLTDEMVSGQAAPWSTIVGVAPTVRQRTLQDPDPTVYLPYRAEPVQRVWLLVRSGDASAATAALREEIRGLDPDLPLFSITPMDRLLSQSRWPYRLFSILFALFAAIALGLSTVGLYAVVAHSVAQRTQEIAVRMALGARAAQVLWLAARQTSVPIVLGLVFGAAGALGLGRMLASFLIQTSSSDPLALLSVAALLAFVSALACFFPARRAARLDPVLGLRHE